MITSTEQPAERIYTAGEVARIFRVDPKTVTRWCQSGRLPSFRTPGGHRRIREADLAPLLVPQND